MMTTAFIITRKGFALIELLVVVSIIAVLAGMLIMGAAMVRGQVKQMQCVSNLRQLGIGMLIYASDNDNMMPCYQVPAPDRDLLSLPMWGMWYGFIKPYLPTGEGAPLYWCPAGCFSLAEVRAMGEFNAATSSYGLSSPDDLNACLWYARPLTAVPRPDQTIMLADHWGADNSGSAIADIFGGVDDPGHGGIVSGPRRPGIGAYSIRASHPRNTSTNPASGRVGTVFYSGRAEALRWQDSYNQASIWNAPNQWLGKY